MTVTIELSPKEETQLRTEGSARAALIKSLLMQGAIPFIPEGRSGPDPKPITVRGEPVSETIIAERR